MSFVGIFEAIPPQHL